MRMMRVVLTIAIAATASSVIAQQSVDPTLTAAIAARDKAFTSRNADETAKYTADDYFGIGPTGRLTNKKQRIDGLRAPAGPGATPVPPQRTEAVRMYGATAAIARMKQPDIRQLFVWVKNAQGWQVVAVHNVPDAPGAPATAPPPPPKAALPSTVPAMPGLTGDKADVFAAFKQIQDAIMSGDRTAYNKLTSLEYFQASRGLLRFSDETTANIIAPRVPPKYSNVAVQTWEQIAVVRWYETSGQGDTNWFTRVFAKKGSGWQQVALAISKAGDPPVAP